MTEAYADRVGEVGFAAWAANPVLNDFGADVSERVCSAFRDFAATGSKVILVAESDGEIVGWGPQDSASRHSRKKRQSYSSIRTRRLHHYLARY